MKPLLLTVLFLIPASAVAQAGYGTVTGKIHFNDGTPAEGVRVSLMIAPDSNKETNGVTALVHIAQTESDGSYHLNDVPPGRYYIVAGRLDAPTYYPGTLDPKSAQIFTIEAGSNTDVLAFAIPSAIASLGGVGRISGKVVNENGRPPILLRKLYVLVRNARKTTVFGEDGVRIQGSGTFGAIPVSRDGRFELSLKDGEYPVSLITGLGEPLSAGDGYYVKSITFGAVDLLKEKLTVRGPTSSTITITVAAPREPPNPR
jgi:hypothetical protein